jgi:hypothetical protein
MSGNVLDPGASYPNSERIYALYDGVVTGSNPGDIRVVNGVTLNESSKIDRVKLSASTDEQHGIVCVALTANTGMVSAATAKAGNTDRKGRFLFRGLCKAKVEVTNGGGANDIAVWDKLMVDGGNDALKKVAASAGAGAVVTEKIVAYAQEAYANAGGSPVEVLLEVIFDGEAGFGQNQVENVT